ncbi:MAG TPA: MlaD family protein [Pyrinomonadaceae bacterium]|nr:MlaD family protein [Pyrinomonadaceae bacterium]
MASRQQKLTLSELRVGIFMLAALLVTGFLILNSSGDFHPFEKRMTLKARFSSADGLRKGADVQLAGVSIGKVDEVKFLPPDSPAGERVEATFLIVQELDKKPITELIRTDSTAQLVATSMLANDKMINIIPGTTKGQPVTDNAILTSSTAISINQLTATGNDLLTQINKIAVPANEILNKANQGEGTLGRIINDESLYKSLDSTVNETKATMVRLQTTLDKVNKGQGSAGKLVNDPELYDSLNKTVSHLEAISADIKAGRGSAGKFVSDDAMYNETRDAVAELRKAVAKMSDIADDVKSVTVDLKDGKGSAGKLLKDDQLYNEARTALEKFNSTTTHLEAILGDARGGKGTIGKLLTDETLYNSINQTASNVNQFTSEGTKLLYDFRQNPKKFLRIKLAIF